MARCQEAMLQSRPEPPMPAPLAAGASLFNASPAPPSMGGTSPPASPQPRPVASSCGGSGRSGGGGREADTARLLRSMPYERLQLTIPEEPDAANSSGLTAPGGGGAVDGSEGGGGGFCASPRWRPLVHEAIDDAVARAAALRGAGVEVEMFASFIEVRGGPARGGDPGYKCCAIISSWRGHQAGCCGGKRKHWYLLSSPD